MPDGEDIPFGTPSPGTVLDHLRGAEHRKAWVHFAAATLTVGIGVAASADCADEMLIEYASRFPSPFGGARVPDEAGGA